MALADKGYLTLEELKENIAAYPSEERFAKGPVAECTKDLPYQKTR